MTGKDMTSMIEQILEQAVKMNASDIFMISGMPVSIKINGTIQHLNEEKIYPDTLDNYIKEIYHLSHERSMEQILTHGDDDFSFSIPGLSRFRVSVLKQRGSLGAVIRIVHFTLPNPNDIYIPDSVMNIANMRKGFVLITGAAGNGKSTTLACIIDRINNTRNAHVITLEDPIEYLHRHNKSIVTQREIGQDTDSYVDGLRACLRQAPDVILLGEMRDYETIRTAITAAETGHLVISTLHTTGASDTIDRIIDVFPPDAQQQIRVQLAMVLQMIVSQQLVPSTDGRLIPAFEIMPVTDAVRTMIRESKSHQISNVIATGSTDGMISMNNSLQELQRKGLITEEIRKKYSIISQQPMTFHL